MTMYMREHFTPTVRNSHTIVVNHGTDVDNESARSNQSHIGRESLSLNECGV
jgi:hypothetical protein